VSLVRFGNFKALLAKYIPQVINDRLDVESSMQGIDYIKIPHPGSLNGMAENILKAVMPKIAVISVGKNSWGFLQPDILDMSGRYGVKILRTD